jgi:ATP-binding cassette subfamily F protein 3
MDSIENEIQSAEAALASLEDELADPSAWSTPERSAKSSKRHEQAKQRIERLYEELSTLEA